MNNGDFCCWIYKQYGKKQCSSHYISYGELYSLILQDIRYHAELVCYRPKAFRQRLPELGRIIGQLYEDKALGKIPLVRFE